MYSSCQKWLSGLWGTRRLMVTKAKNWEKVCFKNAQISQKGTGVHDRLCVLYFRMHHSYCLSMIQWDVEKNPSTWQVLKPNDKETVLLLSYLDVCVCGPSDPKKRFLFGFLMQRYRVQKLPPTPGRPSVAQGPVASALPSCPTWAAVHFTPPLTFWFLSAELRSHWGDILF